MALLRPIFTVGGLTLASRILGFARDIMVAAILGAGMLADVFFIAFKFPNLFRRLFAEGAFNAAFVPLYVEITEEEGKDKARAFAEQAQAFLLWALLIFIAIVELAMPLFMYLFAPGFATQPEKFDLAVLLTRIAFPYLLFISLATLMAGVMNAMGRFAAAAATPILLNICLIGAVIGLAPLSKTPAHALALGIAVAGLVQFIWMRVFCIQAGMTLRLRRPRLTPQLKQMLRRIVPAAIGAGAYQVNLLIDTIIASFLPTGSISYLFFAERINQLPLGVIGVAVGTALLPLLSRQLRAGQATEAMNSQNRALEFALILTLPAAAALMAIAGPVIAVLFERGAFGPQEVKATAAALSVYAAGLPAYVLVKAAAPGFFARGDTATPVKIGVATMVINLILNLTLMGPLLHVGIAMASAVSSWFNAGILIAILMRRGHFKLDKRLISRLPRMTAASMGVAAFLTVAAPWLQTMLAGEVSERIIALAALVSGGLLTFALLAHVLGIAELNDFKRFMKKDVS